VNRVKVEEEILEKMDHPFLLTLYAKFQTEHHINFVTEFCAGGELYELLLQQPNRRFKEAQMRFYAAEVLVGLQYLHLLGYIYRDLKPENVLLTESGHIVLSDFDLSYAAYTTPHLQRREKNGDETTRREYRATSVPMRVPRTGFSMNRSSRSDHDDLMMVAEPEAMANSFVGTEEYLAPEVINATGHNGAVDWWSLGIFMYEMAAGTTPFKGAKRDHTFNNVMNNDLQFPTTPEFSPELKDLLTKLLHKDPAKRLGSVGGAEDIKRHPFFGSINFALIQEMEPPFRSSKESKQQKKDDEEQFRMDP